MKVTYFILPLLVACFALNASERHIALLVQPDWRGEISFAYRIKNACNNIHWQADIVPLQDAQDLKKTKYDFVINLTPGIYEHPECKNYMAIFHPVHHYFKYNGFLKTEYRSYDGYLLTYSPNSFGNGKKDFAHKNKFPYIQWYPTAQRQEFKIVDPLHLFYICCPWGDRFDNIKFQQCLSLLDKEPYTRFYGNPLFHSLYPRSYQGQISYDRDRLYEVAAQAGVSLVIHSSDHNAYGLPSGRIFEAAAASTVIICDQNNFVKEHFMDSVLYIDTDQDGLSIYSQIQRHMNWIRTNKIAALEKAKKAHEIYKQKFLLEDQLIQLGKFHDQLSNDRNENGKNY